MNTGEDFAIATEEDLTYATRAELSAVMNKLASIDEARAKAVAERNQLIHDLLPALNAVILSELTGLSTTGIYKIARRQKVGS